MLSSEWVLSHMLLDSWSRSRIRRKSDWLMKEKEKKDAEHKTESGVKGSI